MSSLGNMIKNRGYTLVEMLIYGFVLVLLTTALVVATVSLRQVFVKAAVDRAMTEAGMIALERIVREIRDAESVDLGLSSFGTATSALALRDGTRTVIFSMSNGELLLSQNGATGEPLFAHDAVGITGFQAFRYVSGTTSEMVRVIVETTGTHRYASSTRRFYGGAILRGLYEG